MKVFASAPVFPLCYSVFPVIQSIAGKLCPVLAWEGEADREGVWDISVHSGTFFSIIKLLATPSASSKAR